MVQELPRTRQQGAFPESAPAALPVFYRTYSRGERETWAQVCDRTLGGWWSWASSPTRNGI
jgi:ribonucleotide reductase class II